MLCSYCNEPAEFTLKNGKPCCSKSSNSCPQIRQKNATGLQKAHSDGRMRYDQLDDTRAWSKGKTAYSDSRIKAGDTRNAMFSLNSNVNNGTLKRVLIDEKIREYKCEKCGNSGEWCGEVLVLQLDHINGNNKDNRLENLRFLCPNCHTQTVTHGGKKGGKLKISLGNLPNDEQLISVVRTTKSISSALKKLGLSETRGNYARIYNLAIKHDLKLNTKRISEQIEWDKHDLAAIYKECGTISGMVRYFEGKTCYDTIKRQMTKRGIDWKIL